MVGIIEEQGEGEEGEGEDEGVRGSTAELGDSSPSSNNNAKARAR